jgi:hypothetical protein
MAASAGSATKVDLDLGYAGALMIFTGYSTLSILSSSLAVAALQVLFLIRAYLGGFS